MRPPLKKIALIVGGIALSVALALVIEGVTSYSSPGVRIQSYVLPSRGPDDMTRFLALAVVLDSAFCFAVLSGMYMLFAKLSGERRK
jgi:mannitol-specific phosphotransferase system IIBC component